MCGQRRAGVERAQETLGGGELVEGDVFVGLVRLRDVAGAADDRGDAGALEQAGLGAERDERRPLLGGEMAREDAGSTARIAGSSDSAYARSSACMSSASVPGRLRNS